MSEILHAWNEASAYLQERDPILGKWIEKVGDCQLAIRRAEQDLFTALASAIIYQQLSGKAATTIWNRFVALYDRSSPRPEEVLATSDEMFRQVGVSRQKAGYLRDLAQKMVSEIPSLQELAQKDDQEIIQVVTRVKGIGIWTAQMLLMFRLGRPDVLPVDDLGIRSGVRKVYGLPEAPGKREVERIGEVWKPWRSVASWYLWRSLETEL